ncbi:MAG: hypothetical protein KBG21_07980 [Ignavibacteria bacterium]|nr:hypothetical protein [Ignavibacteria bacterium]
MTKKLVEAPELSGMTDDEIYYQGERFIESLAEVIEEGRAALGNRYEFRIIEQCYKELLKKFKAEERIAA